MYDAHEYADPYAFTDASTFIFTAMDLRNNEIGRQTVFESESKNMFGAYRISTPIYNKLSNGELWIREGDYLIPSYN